MATYSYECSQCGEIVEKSAPIGTAQRMTSCAMCGGLSRLRVGVGVNISAHATPTKGGDVIAADDRESRWNDDMPAYARLRKRGMQPRTVEGAAALEDRVADQTDIDRERLAGMGVSRERFVEAQAEAQSLKFEALNEASS